MKRPEEEAPFAPRATIRSSHNALSRLFEGPGEMRALARGYDWSATPLGPVATWPASLKTVVALI